LLIKYDRFVVELERVKIYAADYTSCIGFISATLDLAAAAFMATIAYLIIISTILSLNPQNNDDQK